jgi:hypothetical protein
MRRTQSGNNRCKIDEVCIVAIYGADLHIAATGCLGVGKMIKQRARCCGLQRGKPFTLPRAAVATLLFGQSRFEHVRISRERLAQRCCHYRDPLPEWQRDEDGSRVADASSDSCINYCIRLFSFDDGVVWSITMKTTKIRGCLS